MFATYTVLLFGGVLVQIFVMSFLFQWNSFFIILADSCKNYPLPILSFADYFLFFLDTYCWLSYQLFCLPVLYIYSMQWDLIDDDHKSISLFNLISSTKYLHLPYVYYQLFFHTKVLGVSLFFNLAYLIFAMLCILLTPRSPWHTTLIPNILASINIQC